MIHSSTRHRIAAIFAVVGFMAASIVLQSPSARADSVDDQWHYVDKSVAGVYKPIVGYFNHDKMTDILWYGVGKDLDSLWLGTSTPGKFTVKSISINGVYQPIAGDFAGDSYTDIFWYGIGSKADALWTSNGTSTIFSSSVQSQPGEYYLFKTYPGDSTIYWSGAGGYVMRDLDWGKDDIMWLSGQYGSESYWHFDDSGSGSHTTVPLSISADYLPIRGNFSGGTPYDDVLLYRPGTKPDYLWTANGDGTFSQKQVAINGRYQPVTIPRTELNATASDQKIDSILWFDQDHCGKSNPIWHFTGQNSWSTRGVSIPYYSDEGCLDSNAFSLDGTSSAVASLADCYEGNYFVSPCWDYEIFDQTSGASISYLTPESDTRDVDFDYTGDTNKVMTGDFNGDGKADIFYYQSGSAPDSIWYSRTAMVSGVSGASRSFQPETNPDGVPAAPLQ